jgi:hypothetical protein
MMVNEFRRIALAQGLLPWTPASPLAKPPAVEGADTACTPDKPAVAERHDQDA